MMFHSHLDASSAQGECFIVDVFGKVNGGGIKHFSICCKLKRLSGCKYFETTCALFIFHIIIVHLCFSRKILEYTG